MSSEDVLVVVGVGGIGEAIARLVGSGCQVLLADFDQNALTRVAEGLSASGYHVVAQPVDVSSRTSVAALAEAAAALGPVMKVAHTAGLSGSQASQEAVTAVDLGGVAYSLEEFGRVVARGGAGVVVASMAGHFAQGLLPAELEQQLMTTPGEDLPTLPFVASLPDVSAAYSIAKRGNQLRVQAASLAWGARGARVNSISPGVISTPMGLQELASPNGELMRGLIEQSGTGRIGTPMDVALVAAFLLGSGSSFVTGTDVLVDGGAVAAVRAGAVTLAAPA